MDVGILILFASSGSTFVDLFIRGVQLKLIDPIIRVLQFNCNRQKIVLIIWTALVVEGFRVHNDAFFVVV